jgi:hypothetical protein
MPSDRTSPNDSEANAETADVESNVPPGGAYVGRAGVLWMSAYVMLLGGFLFYSLVAVWPRSVTLSVTSVEPSDGPTTGRSVTIFGTGFIDGVQVFFDNTPSHVTSVAETSISAMAPPHTEEGLVAVQVISPNGQKSSLPNAFKYGPAGAAAPQETPARSASSQAAANAAPATKNSGDAASAGNSAGKNTPAAPSAEAGGSGCTKASSLPLFEWACSLRDNIRLLLVVIIVGALGSLIHVMRSFYWYVGNRVLRSSWLLMYILLPFVGAGLALLFYLIIRGGFAPQSVPTQGTIDSYAALAALVGMFSQQALAKLKQIAESVFTTADKGKDQATSATVLKLAALKPTSGPTAGGTVVTLTGTGFSDRIEARFGGTPATNLKRMGDTQMQATTPAHAAGAVDVEVSNNAGQNSSLPAAFTYMESPPSPPRPVPGAG